MNTRVGRRLGIPVPIVQGGIQRVGAAGMGAAASDGGGLAPAQVRA